MYKYTTWKNVMENEKVTVATELNEASNQIDPYCCAILIKSGESVVTAGHIFRKISWHCYFFLRDEGREISGNVFCTTYQPSPIPSGGLGIPLVLKFQSPKNPKHCRRIQSKTSHKLYVVIGKPAQRLILAMNNPRRKSAFQLKKET